MQVDQRGAAVDVARVARAGGDEAVEGLAEDGDAAAGLPRSDRLGEEQLEQLAGRRAEPLQAARDAAGPPVHDHRGGAVGPGPHLLARDREGQLARAAAPRRRRRGPPATGARRRRPRGPGRLPAPRRSARAPGPGRPARRRPRFVRFHPRPPRRSPAAAENDAGPAPGPARWTRPATAPRCGAVRGSGWRSLGRRRPRPVLRPRLRRRPVAVDVPRAAGTVRPRGAASTPASCGPAISASTSAPTSAAARSAGRGSARGWWRSSPSRTWRSSCGCCAGRSAA